MIFILLVHLLLYDVHFELLILVVLGCVRFHVFLFLQGIVTIWSDLGAQEADDAVDASVVPQARSILWSRLRQFVYQVLRCALLCLRSLPPTSCTRSQYPSLLKKCPAATFEPLFSRGEGTTSRCNLNTFCDLEVIVDVWM